MLDSVDDLKSSLHNVIDNPRLMAHVSKTHEATIHSIFESADPSNRRKRRRMTVAEPAEEHAEVTALRLKHEQIELKCWPLTIHAASFIRPAKQSDHNTVIKTKKLAMGTASIETNQALLFVTVYNKLSYGHRLLSRSSQHVMLSSQTLGDFFEAIPCVFNEVPQERVDTSGKVTGYEDAMHEGSTGCVLCIENVLYGDSQSEEDYAEKLTKVINEIPEGKRPDVNKGTPMHETTFSSLSLRLHKPYWLLHAGNCEHFFVIDAIRLYHPSDPSPADYPLTTQITPPLLDTCRVCNRAPAVYSIVGDIRFGESPFVICIPCWRWMGKPKEGEQVLVVPLPKYELGWAG
ncbi:snRNA-activating protein complex subunit 3 [Grifola frondosa]|uniref:snRNA-activating protein complex subunit 3 n=1 Tax=Grifola frondosa TaxID=5627 RepID=A0A1C7LVA9_GRIFR|nr:snRNA-activating protein complex subunit 3 [Grifola frondosa]